MGKHDYDLGIIGGGAAGLTAAAGSAQFGAKTILIEKSSRLGGDCLHFGCVPSKTLIRIAGVRHLARTSSEFGLPHDPLTPVDLARVMERVRDVIGRIEEHDSVARFCGLGAEIQFGSPSFVDEHTVEMEGKRVSAANWIIATGSRPLVPAIPGLDRVPYWTNETVFLQRILPGRLVVLGGGPVGLEIAQAFSRLGSQVVVVEFMNRILGPEDEDVADLLHRRIVAEGIEVHTSTKVSRVELVNGSIHLSITRADGDGGETVIEGDAIFIAAGRGPRLDGLGLERAGVVFTPRGIPTNVRMRTNVPHIYACGDVNGRLPFTHVAGYEAGVALTNAILHLPRRGNYEQIGWCTYTDPEVASVGLNENRARQTGQSYHVIEEFFAENDRALTDGEAMGKIKILLDKRDRILGCQIIGARAGELIHEWVVAMAGGMKLSTIAGAVHIYPTLSEISKRAAGRVFAEKLFSDRTKSVLKFLFALKGRACKLPVGPEEWKER